MSSDASTTVATNELLTKPHKCIVKQQWPHFFLLLSLLSYCVNIARKKMYSRSRARRHLKTSVRCGRKRRIIHFWTNQRRHTHKRNVYMTRHYYSKAAKNSIISVHGFIFFHFILLIWENEWEDHWIAKNLTPLCSRLNLKWLVFSASFLCTKRIPFWWIYTLFSHLLLLC